MHSILFYSLCLVGVAVGYAVLYFVVKIAVKHGISEARAPLPSQPAGSRLQRVQDQYDKGLITFEAYQAEWNKA